MDFQSPRFTMCRVVLLKRWFFIWSMQYLQLRFYKFSYIFIHSKCLCKLQHTWDFEEFSFKQIWSMQYLQFGFTKFLYIFIHTIVYANYNILGTLKNLVLNGFGKCNICSSDCMFCMHNLVQIFGESAFHIYHWLNYFSFNPSSIFTIEWITFRWIRLTYLQLTKKLLRCFVRHFMYAIRTCIMLIMLVSLLAHNFFGNHVVNFFWSITQCSIQSICLWSIRHENDDWPHFFSRSCFWPNRSLMLSVKVDQKPFGQSKIRSILVLWFLIRAFN